MKLGIFSLPHVLVAQGRQRNVEKVWCTCRVVVLFIRPTACLTFLLPSQSSDLKVPKIVRIARLPIRAAILISYVPTHLQPGCMAARNAKRWISTILRKDKGLWIVYAEDNSGGLNRLLKNTYGISQLTEHQRSQSFIVRAKLYCKRLPIQNKLPPYCFWYVRIRSGSKWPMIGPRPCAYARADFDRVFSSQSYDISISTSTRGTNLSVFLVLICLCLCRPSFHLLTHVLVLICLCLCARETVYVFGPLSCNCSK